MKTEFTLPEISALICDADKIADETIRSARYQKLRVLFQKGLLVPTNQVSRGKVAKYSLNGVCEAIIALELTRKGFSDELIRSVLRDLRNPETRHHHNLVQGMRNPKIWNLENAIQTIVTHGDLWELSIWTYDKPDDSVSAWSILYPTTDGLGPEHNKLRARRYLPSNYIDEAEYGRPGVRLVFDLRQRLVDLLNEICEPSGSLDQWPR